MGVVSLDRDMDADIKTDIMDWAIKHTSLDTSMSSGQALHAQSVAEPRM